MGQRIAGPLLSVVSRAPRHGAVPPCSDARRRYRSVDHPGDIRWIPRGERVERLWTTYSCVSTRCCGGTVSEPPWTVQARRGVTCSTAPTQPLSPTHTSRRPPVGKRSPAGKAPLVKDRQAPPARRHRTVAAGLEHSRLRGAGGPDP